MNQEVPHIFDRLRLRQTRARAAARLKHFDFLLTRVAEDMSERIMVQNRHFEQAICLGASTGYLTDALKTRGALDDKLDNKLGNKISHWIESDITPAMLPSGGVVLDEEILPLKPTSLDLVVSFWGLHHVNDLPGTLVQMRQALKPDGLFLAALPGNENLRALSRAFLQAESEILGGVQPHIHPFADLRDLAGLMQRAGFALPVADSNIVPVRYRDPLRLLADLRGMGESNILAGRAGKPLRRDVLNRAMALFCEATQQNGKAEAMFEICYLAGFAPPTRQHAKHEAGQPITRFDDTLMTR